MNEIQDTHFGPGLFFKIWSLEPISRNISCFFVVFFTIFMMVWHMKICDRRLLRPERSSVACLCIFYVAPFCTAASTAFSWWRLSDVKKWLKHLWLEYTELSTTHVQYTRLMIPFLIYASSNQGQRIRPIWLHGFCIIILLNCFRYISGTKHNQAYNTWMGRRSFARSLQVWANFRDTEVWLWHWDRFVMTLIMSCIRSTEVKVKLSNECLLYQQTSW